MMNTLISCKHNARQYQIFNSFAGEKKKKNLDLDSLCLGPNYNIFLKSPVCEGQNGAGPICMGQTV